MTYRRGWIALLLFAVVIINYMDRIVLSVASRSIAAEFRFSPIQMGFLFSSFLWAYVLCLIPFGILTDKVGAKRMVGAGIGIWSSATAATAAITGFASILGARLIMGASEATTFPACGRVIRDWFPEKERGMVTTLFNGGGSAGPAIGAVVAAALINYWGWRITFVVLGAIGLLWFTVWQVWYGDPLEVAWLEPAEEDKIVAERNGKSGTTSDENAHPSSLRYLLSQKSVWGLVITQACFVYTTYLFLTWLPAYLQSTRQLTTMSTGYLTALPYLGTVILSVSIGWVSDRTLSSAAIQAGNRRNFIASMALLSMMILFAPMVRELWQLLVILMLVLAGSTTGAGLNFTLASDLLRSPQDVSRVIAITAFGGNLFGLISPIITGYVVASSGRYTWTFRIAAALLLCGGISTLLMTRTAISPECKAIKSQFGSVMV